MKRSTAVLTTLLTGLGLAALGPAASQAAPARANVTVTIASEGTDIFGTVKSAKPAQCANDRMVRVYRIVQGEPVLFAMDTSSRQGNAYTWSIGNPGTEGRFYAQVGLKQGCKADTSPTIRVRRNP